MAGVVSQNVITTEKPITNVKTSYFEYRRLNTLTSAQVPVYTMKSEWCPYVPEKFCQESYCDECCVRDSRVSSLKNEL
jgi:hypothetical protein